MRINPIINFNVNKQTYTNNNTHTQPIIQKHDNFNLNSLNSTYNQISFQANIADEANKYIAETLAKIPLKHRLGALLDAFAPGDLIVLGKNFEKAKEGLFNAIPYMENPIKKVIFMPDQKFKGYVGFMRDWDWGIQAFNLNKFDMTLARDEKRYIIEPGKAINILDNDIIETQGYLLDIKPQESDSLLQFANDFSQTHNFSIDLSNEIEKVNTKILNKMFTESTENNTKITFKDVGGQDKLIEELKKSILYPLKFPEAYSTFDVNKGFILYGPPGTGKTHIARALANEANVNFVSLNGSELESKWVGESEENWRNLFNSAKEKQPTIIFVDEMDSVAKSRGGKDVHGDKVVNQILTLMTDIDNNKDNIIVIGATNNFEALDKAIIRSGRFSKHLEVKMPDKEGLSKIFDIHTRKKPIDRNLNKDKIIQKLSDLKCSGADVKYIVNEAHSIGYDRMGIYEKMENETLTSKDLRSFYITNEDFDKAIEKFVETRNSTDRKPIGFNR